METVPNSAHCVGHKLEKNNFKLFRRRHAFLSFARAEQILAQRTKPLRRSTVRSYVISTDFRSSPKVLLQHSLFSLLVLLDCQASLVHRSNDHHRTRVDLSHHLHVKSSFFNSEEIEFWFPSRLLFSPKFFRLFFAIDTVFCIIHTYNFTRLFQHDVFHPMDMPVAPCFNPGAHGRLYSFCSSASWIAATVLKEQ
jgi:hypothetical protein